MIKPVYLVSGFDLKAAITLIAITFVVGYIFGFAGGILWNKLHRS